MQTQKMSLSFNQMTQSVPSSINARTINPSSISFGIQSINTFGTINRTNLFNNHFNEVFTNLSSIRNHYQQQIDYGLSFDPNVQSKVLRDRGVDLAWKYERAEVAIGGDGTYQWSEAQKQELIKNGKVSTEGSNSAMPGHHIYNVRSSPELQSNPDNIQFAKDYKEHLHKYHNGNFQNPTQGDLFDRDQRLVDSNNKRIFSNEIAGIGAAAAIGLGVGFTIGFVVTLAQAGLSTENLINAAIIGAKSGIEGVALGVMNHLIIRGIGETVSNALQGVVANLGLTVTQNISKMCNMAAFGGLAIVVFSVYQFTKLKLLGYSTKECLIRVGKSAAFSASVLLISIVAQGIYGGHVGIIVSLSIGVLVLTYKVIESQHNKKVGEKIRIYMIQKCQPILLEI